MRYTGPKVKKARRLGMAFTAKDAKIMQRCAYPPGQHGQSRGRLSEYALQLREKQKAKANYGIVERQFARYFERARHRPGVTGDNLLQLLELRLDNVVYRLGFAGTRAQARQLVNHGFFEVNGRKVDVPSFALKVGDIVQVRAAKQDSAYIQKLQEQLPHIQTQEWIELRPAELSGTVLAAPTPEQIQNLIDTQLIVEYYSRI
jgi:small subunit ribosomal protein S4